MGELNDYRKGLDSHCGIMFENFCEIYADLLLPNALEKLHVAHGAVEQLDALCQICDRSNQKIYLFIDEYDHFTNSLLSNPESLYRYTNETHGEGYLRAFFNKIKAGTYSCIKRCFITGELKRGFPASNMVNPDNFVSLLFYFGMLSIGGLYKGKTKLIIPNLVVQEQLYTYLLSTYNEADKRTAIPIPKR